MAVNFIDRYCVLKTNADEIKRSQYQLVGVASLMIAAKYEEIYPPYPQDYVYLTDNAYTKEQLLEMEKDILESLKFELTVPTAYRFLERYAKLAKCDKRLFHLANYFCQLCLIEINMNKW